MEFTMNLAVKVTKKHVNYHKVDWNIGKYGIWSTIDESMGGFIVLPKDNDGWWIWADRLQAVSYDMGRWF